MASSHSSPMCVCVPKVLHLYLFLYLCMLNEYLVCCIVLLNSRSAIDVPQMTCHVYINNCNCVFIAHFSQLQRLLIDSHFHNHKVRHMCHLLIDAAISL